MDVHEQQTPFLQSTWVSLPAPNFYECQRIINELEVHDLKPSIALIRYGVIPKPTDTVLWGKMTDTLRAKFFFFNSSSNTFSVSLDGLIFFAVSTRPVIASSAISMVLARIPPPSLLEDLRVQSISKELSVMESTPRPAVIRWKHFFDSSTEDYSIGEGIPPNPTMTKKIRLSLLRYRHIISDKILWPYSTRRGISQETSREYLGKTLNLVKPWHDEGCDVSPVSSRDVVSYYLHYDDWVGGDCEMKQRWYPSGLLPRTYYAQGGDAIRVSSYLRDFFNELCDCFLPTDRYARVDGSRLITYDNGYFFIYDLTSFTSNFHEQYSFLTEVASFFRGTRVYLVSAQLQVLPSDLGEMVMEYANVINLRPRYRFSRRLPIICESAHPQTHMIAGFLGVPGNLASCTLSHGILLSQHVDDESKQSCAGDDGCLGCLDEKHQQDMSGTIRLLGIFQTEKGSTTRLGQAASYLKRRFAQDGKHAYFFERVEFIMLSLVHAYKSPDPRFPELSLDRSKLRSSCAKSATQLVRSLYEYTKGTYLPGELEFILDFLSYIYRLLDLPREGQLRGMLFDENDSVRKVRDSLVFPLNKEYLEQDPDVLISERFLPWVVAFPEITKVDCSDFHGDWLSGEKRTFRMSSVVEKLVKYGWLRREQTPKRYLVGEDARRFFRRLMKEEIRDLEYEYTCVLSLTSDKLEELGVYRGRLLSSSQSLSRKLSRISQWVDYDDPLLQSEDQVMSLSLRYASELQASRMTNMGELDY